MTPVGSHTDLVLRLRTALGTDDLAAAGKLLDEAVRLHVPGSHPTAGEYRGLQGILDFYAASRATGASTAVEVIDVLEGREHVAVYCHVTGTRPDRAVLQNPTLHLYRVDGGRVAEIWFHNRDQAAVDAFWR
jgi:hypothetical protein